MVSEPWVPSNTIGQDIEARALVLLDLNSESAIPVSSLFAKYPNVKTPRHIHHDYEERVVIMADLGSSVVTIDDLLTQEPAPLYEDVELSLKIWVVSSANSLLPPASQAWSFYLFFNFLPTQPCYISSMDM